jgi:hypothetical protein
VDLSAAVTNGNGHTFKIGLFTSKQDILGPFSAAQYTSAAGFTGTLNDQSFGTVFDGSGDTAVSIEYTNNLYAYAWLERNTGGETETTPALELAVRQSPYMYPRIHSVSAATGANVSAFMPANVSAPGTDSFGYSVYAYDPAIPFATAETDTASAITTYLNTENKIVVANGVTFTGMTAPAANVAFDVVMVMKSNDGSTIVSATATQSAAPQIGDTTFTVIEPPIRSVRAFVGATEIAVEAELAASPKPNNYAIAFDESVNQDQIEAILGNASARATAVQLAAADGSAVLSQYVDVTGGAFQSVASVSTIDFASNTPPNMYTYVLASDKTIDLFASTNDFVAMSTQDTTHEFVRSAAEPDGNVICDVTALTFSGSGATLQLSVAANIAIAPFTAGAVKAYTVALSVNTLDDANVAAAIG